jgi:hypothetical protein
MPAPGRRARSSRCRRRRAVGRGVESLVGGLEPGGHGGDLGLQALDLGGVGGTLLEQSHSSPATVSDRWRPGACDRPRVFGAGRWSGTPRSMSTTVARKMYDFNKAVVVASIDTTRTVIGAVGDGVSAAVKTFRDSGHRGRADPLGRRPHGDQASTGAKEVVGQARAQGERRRAGSTRSPTGPLVARPRRRRQPLHRHPLRGVDEGRALRAGPGARHRRPLRHVEVPADQGPPRPLIPPPPHPQPTCLPGTVPTPVPRRQVGAFGP